jgi:hypothetical protein
VAVLDILLLGEGLVLVVVVKIMSHSWKNSRIRRLELSVRDIQSLAVNSSVQASTLSQYFSMGYAVVAVGPGNIDQLPRGSASRVPRSGFAADFEFRALHCGAVGGMAATWVLWCCLVAHCKIVEIGGRSERLWYRAGSQLV